MFEIIVSIVGLFGVCEFYQYRKRQRSEAACHVLGALWSCNDYMNEMWRKYELFEHGGYYPDKIPETCYEKSETHKERPFRLVHNYLWALSTNLYPLIAKIGGKKSVELQSLLKDYRQYALSLVASVEVKFDKHMGDSAQKNIERCNKKIEEINNKLEKILKPIAEGRDAFGWRPINYIHKKWVNRTNILTIFFRLIAIFCFFTPV